MPVKKNCSCEKNFFGDQIYRGVVLNTEKRNTHYAKIKHGDIAQEIAAGKYIKNPYTLAKMRLAVKEELEK